jgi:dienelactone hydrolase
MRERQSPFLDVVMGVGLISLLGLSVARARTTPPAAVAVTFPASEANVQLTGQLYQPAGEGPFPAVVFLHGCAGIDPVQHHWAHRLQQWGYVVLLVDSFGPRGVTNVCTGGVALSPVDPQYVRMPDAYAAQAYLARQPRVDAQRIALMGWAVGGRAALYAVDSLYLAEIRPTPFKAAVALYPLCLYGGLRQVNAPLLILIGEEDDWTPVGYCRDMMRRSAEVEGQSIDDITLQVYPGARHAFDSREALHRVVGTSPSGHLVGRHEAAAAQAEAEVKRFLAQHFALKP